LNRIVGALMVCTVLWLAAPVVSRECGNNIPELLDRIEKAESDSDSAELAELIRCLSEPAGKWISDDDAFFSEDALEKIEAETNRDRLRVYKILIPLVASDDWLVSREAAGSLAYFGYAPAGQMLDGYPDGPLKAVLYAIVDYKDSYRWAIDRLLRIERGSQPEGDLHDVRTTYLGLLFHLAEPLSLPFLNKLILSGDDPEIRARAQQVKRRILELNPELK
jgi:hypothetical protein